MKFTNESDVEEFKSFVIQIANTTFENMDTVSLINRTFDIPSSDYLDLMYNLSFVFNPEISSGTAIKLKVQPTITELGICYAVNSKVAIYNSYEYWKNNSWDLAAASSIVVVHPLDGEIYAQMINLSTSFEVYFHGSMEIPQLSKQRYSFLKSDYTTVELKALETKTSASVAELVGNFFGYKFDRSYFFFPDFQFINISKTMSIRTRE